VRILLAGLVKAGNFTPGWIRRATLEQIALKNPKFISQPKPDGRSVEEMVSFQPGVFRPGPPRLFTLK